MEKLEFEVKFFVPDNRRSLRQDILYLGARSRGRFFEHNIRFENSNKTLRSKKCLSPTKMNVRVDTRNPYISCRP